MQGIIFDIKRFAVHDGSGIRQTIFFKGCPLKCWWCHNPESQSPNVEQYEKTLKAENITKKQSQNVGYTISTDELLLKIKADISFFDESGGGVTFSGGEPMLQHDFLLDILQKCKQEGIHTAVDTTGYCSEKALETILPYTDLFLYDIKHLDNKIHIAQTGVSVLPILRNFQKILNSQKTIIVRYPLIPGINDSIEYCEKLKNYLFQYKEKIESIDILPFHKISDHKYDRMNIMNKMKNVDLHTNEYVKDIEKYFISHGFRVKTGG